MQVDVERQQRGNTHDGHDEKRRDDHAATFGQSAYAAVLDVRAVAPSRAHVLRRSCQGRHFEHRRDERGGHRSVSCRGQMHPVEREQRIGEIDGLSQVHVANTPIAGEAALEHAGELMLRSMWRARSEPRL